MLWSMTTLAIDRDIALETAYNVRHLGGYPTAAGPTTTATDLLRGATLHELTERGCEALRAHGVRTVVDLRSEVEHEASPTPDLSAYAITVIEAPVFQADASPGALVKNEGYPGHAVVYRSFLVDGGAAYRTLFEAIARDDGGVLFHCAVGKDRTGLAAALLLELAGVPDEHIIADYVRSTAMLEPILDERLAKFAERGIDEDTARMMMAAPAADMEATLAFVRERWGSAADYCAAIGLDEPTTAAVRARVVTD